MDLLQVALVFLILLLAVFLSVLGIQVFYILKDLKKSLERFDAMIGANSGAGEHQVKASPSVAAAFKKRAIRILSGNSKPSKRLFRRR